MWYKILAALPAALPGLIKLINAFRRKKDIEPTLIDSRAASEISALEDWRRESNENAYCGE